MLPIFVLLCALCATGGPAWVTAQVPQARVLLSHIPSSLPGLEVHHTFPHFTHPQQIEAGEEVPVLVTVRNGYNYTVVVSYVTGSVFTPAAPGAAVDNMTVTAYQKALKPEAEQSFEYAFKLNERMPHRDFTIALTLFYNDISTFLGHATTFFNQTVEVLEARRTVDTEALGIVATTIAIVAFIVFMFWSSITELEWFKQYQRKQKKKEKESAAKAQVYDSPQKPDISEYVQVSKRSAVGQKPDARKRQGKKGK